MSSYKLRVTSYRRKFVVFWQRYLWHGWRKYALVLVLFAGYFVAAGDYSLPSRVENRRRLDCLVRERDSLQVEIAENKRLKQELETDDASLGKFAREQYFMRRANEDVYVFE